MASAAISIAARKNKKGEEDIQLISAGSVKERDQTLIDRMLAPASELVTKAGLAQGSAGKSPIDQLKEGLFEWESPQGSESLSKSFLQQDEDEEESEELRHILNKQAAFKKRDLQSFSRRPDSTSGLPGMRRLASMQSQGDLLAKQKHSDLRLKIEKSEAGKSMRTSWSDIDPDTIYFPHWILNPEGAGYLRFFYVTIGLAIIASFVAPYNIAYLDCTSIFTPTNVLMYVIDLVFLADVCVTFFLSVFKKGEWITEPFAIARNYLLTTFTYDLLEALPWDGILKAIYRPRGVAAVKLSMFGLIRLLRLKRLLKFFWDIGVDLNFDYFTTSVVKFSALIVFSAHWAATIFYLLARLRDFDTDTWVGRDEPELPSRGPMFAYLTSIYWAMTTLSTAGYGDFSAYTAEERLWTSIFMLFNLGLTAYVLGNMTVLLTKADAQTAAYRDRLTSINRYMKAHRVPKDIQQQMRAHLKMHYETSEVRDDILKQYPSTIRMRITKHVYAKWVNMPYIFQDTSQVFRDQLTSHMHVDFFVPSMTILTRGDTVNEMYMVASPNSICEVVGMSVGDNEEQVWFEYGQGDCMGEFAFICEGTMVWSVRTVTPCRMLVLERDDFETLAKNHPEDARKVVRNLLERAKALCEAAKRYSSLTSILDISKILHREVQAYIDKQDEQTMMNLCYAAKRGDAFEVYQLLSGGFDLNQADYDGRTALHLAAAYGHDHVVQFLIEKGHPISPRDAFWRTPLQEAVSAAHWSTADILRSHGADLKLRNEGTHMCRLAYQGHIAEVEHLLHYGANPSAADYDGRTALHIAAAEGHVGLLRVLLNGGADVNAMDRWHLSPLDEAIRCNNPDAQALIKARGGKRGSQLPDRTML